jgi:hypothetical protein
MKVTEYNSINIYITPNGKFYCDTVNNSSDYSNKQFESDKLPSIKKAIDNFDGNKTSEKHYKFETYYCKVTEMLQVSSKGKIKIFDDGTNFNTGSYNSNKLIPESEIDSTILFKLLAIENEYNDLTNQLKDINEKMKQTRIDFQNNFNFIKKK